MPANHPSLYTAIILLFLYINYYFLCNFFRMYQPGSIVTCFHKFPRQLKTPYTKCETLIIILHDRSDRNVHPYTPFYTVFSRSIPSNKAQMCQILNSSIRKLDTICLFCNLKMICLIVDVGNNI